MQIAIANRSWTAASGLDFADVKSASAQRLLGSHVRAFLLAF